MAAAETVSVARSDTWWMFSYEADFTFARPAVVSLDRRRFGSFDDLKRSPVRWRRRFPSETFVRVCASTGRRGAPARTE